jgi:hypothetical protein
MSPKAAEWVIGAVMAIGLGIVSIMLGETFLPTGSKAYEDGTFVPWLLAWGMIWTTVLAAIMLTVFLIVVGRKQQGRG